MYNQMTMVLFFHVYSLSVAALVTGIFSIPDTLDIIRKGQDFIFRPWDYPYYDIMMQSWKAAFVTASYSFTNSFTAAGCDVINPYKMALEPELHMITTIEFEEIGCYFSSSWIVTLCMAWLAVEENLYYGRLIQ